MLFLVLPLLSLLTFWGPLLLSIRAMKRPENSQFLLTYWLVYATISNIQSFFSVYLGGLAMFVAIVAAAFNVWLFYGHGCLVVSHFFGPDILRRTTGVSSVSELDVRFIDPMMVTLVARNPVAQGVMRLLPRKISPFRELLQFNAEFARSLLTSRRVSFLQLMGGFFCYMDSPVELNARYQQCRSLFGKLSDPGPQVRSPEPTRKLPQLPRVASPPDGMHYGEYRSVSDNREYYSRAPRPARSVNYASLISSDDLERFEVEKRGSRRRAASTGDPPYPLKPEVNLVR